MIKTINLTASVLRNAGGLFENVRYLVQSLVAACLDVRLLSNEDEHTAVDKAIEIGPVKPTLIQRLIVQALLAR